MPAIFMLSGVALGLAFLFFLYLDLPETTERRKRHASRSSRRKRPQLEQIKMQVEAFEKQKAILQQRVSTIEQLQRDRTGGQELLDMVANTVSRTENLWLTTVDAQGEQPDPGRLLRFDQLGGELHYRAEALRILPESGNQRIQAGRPEHRGADLSTSKSPLKSAPPQAGAG